MALGIAALCVSIAALTVSFYSARIARANQRLNERAYGDSRRAYLNVEQQPAALHGTANVVYGFAVRNVGKAYARHLRAWGEDRRGRRFDGVVGIETRVLAPGESTTATVLVPLAEAAELDRAWLELRWDDWQQDTVESLEPSSRRKEFDPHSGWARTHLERRR